MHVQWQLQITTLKSCSGSGIKILHVHGLVIHAIQQLDVASWRCSVAQESVSFLVSARKNIQDVMLGWALLHGCPSHDPSLITKTLRTQLNFLTCVAHQRNTLMGNTPACTLGQYVLQLPSDVIQHLTTLM